MNLGLHGQTARTVLTVLVFIAFIQFVLLIGYWLLENVHTVAEQFDKVGNLLTKTDPTPNSGDKSSSSSPVHQNEEFKESAGSNNVNAALISLVRNSELEDLMGSMAMIEDTFNNKFRYPWVFFNDEEFTPEFKEGVQSKTDSTVEFVKIDSLDWIEPEWIDWQKANDSMVKLKESNIQYADKWSYHRMCRWNSGPFFENPVMDKYEYYWRVEPATKYFCDIDYDVFQFMKDHDKDYGFVINLYDNPHTIKTLWNVSDAFFEQHPEYIHDNNAYKWLQQTSRDKSHNSVAGYSTCHFWSNFEIGRVGFFRSDAYRQYFEYLDKAGGFFYERWGDAPVHSIGLGMMTDVTRIHYFEDIGYFHFPYYNCPESNKCKGCAANVFTDIDAIKAENCMGEWNKLFELMRMKF